MTPTDPTIDTNCMTLNRFILQEQRNFPSATGDLTQLLSSISTAVKAIASTVRSDGVTNLFGVAGSDQMENIAIENLSNELFINMLKSSYTACALVSKKNTEIIDLGTGRNEKYIVYFDPLDGSSNFECLAPIGSIFGIAKKPDECTGDLTKEDCLQPGKNYVASGYALYGSATMLVLTTGKDVNGFTLDPSIGEFVLTDPNMRIKERGMIYSINEGNSNTFETPMMDYIASINDPNQGRGVYGARYVGTLVADIHRTIKYGGIFMYPATAAHPNGKLRLLYECNPMAHLVEVAGGLATNGRERLLDITPQELHGKQPIIIGSKYDVEDYMKLSQK